MQIAFLWDESFLWGLMAIKSFRALGVDAEVVTAEDVREGALADAGILVVPGGWASDKTVALGERGREAVKEFVRGGGSYLGLCGGAGLALDVEGGLGLTHVSRIPTKHRVPSFSGGVVLAPEDKSHPIWSGIRPPYEFTAWFPGQFHIGDGDGVRVVARYERPGKDFALADLPAGDVDGYFGDWSRWEEAYGINLNPARLMGEPAIIEAKSGEGRVFLSYLHLETPGSKKGNRALLNVLEYLRPRGKVPPPAGRYKRPRPRVHAVSQDAARAAGEMMKAAREFIAFGERNFLWYWRNGWLLQWRRGVRGVEYSMLYGLIKEIFEAARDGRGSSDPDASAKITALRGRVITFFEGAKGLLMKERYALMNGGMSSIRSHDPEVVRLRESLFSTSKRFGGEFKGILDGLDETVLGFLRGA